jgi:outer membrane protein
MTRSGAPGPCLSLFLALLLAAIPGPAARAQRVLTYDECLARTLQNHPAAAISELSVRSSEAALEEHRRSLMPPVHLNLSAQYAPHGARYGYDAVVTDGGQLTAQVGVTHTLYDGGARGVRTDQLMLDINRSRLEMRRTLRDLRWSLLGAYTDAVESVQLRDVQRQRLDDLAGYAVLAEHLVRGGGGGGSDLLRIRIALENARNALAKSELQIAARKLTLAAMMGAPQDTAFEVQPADPRASLSAADSVLAMNDTTPPLDVAAADLAVQHADLEVDLARAAQLPTISLSGDAGYLSSLDYLQLPAAERVAPFGASIGISIEHPLFGWGAPGQKILQREIDVESARLNLDMEKRSAMSESMRARGELVAARQQLDAYRRILADATDHYALVRAGYMGGTTTALEVLSAEDVLSDAREGVIHASADIDKGVATLKRLATR